MNHFKNNSDITQDIEIKAIDKYRRATGQSSHGLNREYGKI
jgi:hypothetical protein